MTTSRIYVGTYSKYNSGSIAGAWLDLEDYSSSDEFLAACAELHSDESDPEFMFQDWEGIPEGMVGESHIFASLWDWLAMDEDDRKLLSVYREHVDASASLETAQDAYMGTYKNPTDWAEEYAEDTGLLESVPTELRGYFDFTAYARDCGFNGMTFVQVSYDECWVFDR